MGARIKKLKKIRIHREGTSELLYTAIFLFAVNMLLWFVLRAIHPYAPHAVIPFTGGISGFILVAMLNFYRCPIRYFNGNYHKAWLPKASEENEHADIMIETPDGQSILVRQIAGAMARRIVTYAKEGEECYIDEHLGFIKLGSRVDVYLPMTARACVTMNQPTTGDQTVIAKLA